MWSVPPDGYMMLYCSQVVNWLQVLELDQYKDDFMSKGIDGNQLLNMDTNKMKVSQK